jgi:hypothetical protein
MWKFVHGMGKKKNEILSITVEFLVGMTQI